MAGALDKITEAGAVLAGGHSVENDEPKFGLSVVGVVHPDRFWTNAGAQPGDGLVLTKPLGSGVIFNANLKNRVSRSALEACVFALTTLNKGAAETMRTFDIHAVTDITGFGLAGHSLEMARASQVTLSIEMDALPVMEQALEMYRHGVSTGVNTANQRLTAGYARFDKPSPQWHRQIVYDPQTSGGLLVAVPAGQQSELVRALRRAHTPAAALIGRVKPLEDGTHLIFI